MEIKTDYLRIIKQEQQANTGAMAEEENKIRSS